MQRDMGLCQAKFLIGSITCSGPLDVDEIIPRGRGGNYLDPENCQVLCRAHHRWKHDHPAEAERLGLTKSLPPSA
jgi:5-methylcytosine-specific restriction endonuclease McrA